MNRHLTASERFFLRVAEQLVTNNVMLIRCRGALEPARVRAALDAVARRHPGLRVRVVRGAQPWMSSHAVPPIPLRVIERRDAEHWRELVRAEQNTPVDVERGPLARCCLLLGEDACELICTADHLNSDGYSLIALFRDLLRVIDDPDARLVPLREREAFDSYLPAGPLGPLTGGAELIPAPFRNMLVDRSRAIGARWAARGQAGQGASRPAGWGQGTDRGAGQAQPRGRVEFIDRQLDRARSRALLDACRAHQTTVHSALVVAGAQALGQTRRRRRATDVRVGCTSPINVRDMLQPPVGDDYGLFAWSPTTLHRIEPGAEFWQLARQAQRQLDAYRQPASLTALRSLRGVFEIAEGLGSGGDVTAGDPGLHGLLDGTLVASNLGRIELPERAGGVEITGIDVFAMSPGADCLMIVYSFGGRLRFCYCCSPLWSGPGIITRVAAGVEAVLDAASGGPVLGVARGLEYAAQPAEAAPLRGFGERIAEASQRAFERARVG